jgi:LPXTG-site transpeptidase (sortase) family protein
MSVAFQKKSGFFYSSRIIAIFSILAGLFYASPVKAQTTTVLYVSPTGAYSGSCTSWSEPSGACSMAKALAIADPGDEIWAKSGTYASAAYAIDLNINIYGGFYGNETTRAGRNPASYKTIFSGSNVSSHVVTVGSGRTVLLDGLTISDGNTPFSMTTSMNGGGILNYGTLILNDVALINNVAAQKGGGLSNEGGSVTITNSTISGNSVMVSGGGIYNSGVLSITNSTFSGNSAPTGGAIYAYANVATIANSTFAGNNATAAYGAAGIDTYNAASAVITNSIIANAPESAANERNCSGYIPYTDVHITGSNNLSDDDTCTTAFIESTIINLGTLSDNGGPTQTIPILAGSSALNTGSACTATDQRGYGRSGACDIGAFEYNGVAPDSTPPNTIIISHPASWSTSTSATFFFTGSDDITPPVNLTFQCRLDSGSWGNCSSPQGYASLALGSHTFDVRATDQLGNTDASPASFTWTISDIPNARNDSYTINEDQSVSANVDVNDTLSTDDGNTWSNTTSPTRGTLVFNADSSFTYTPNANINGSDTFNYRLCDTNNDCDTATVTISITALDDPVSVTDDAYSTPEDTTLNIPAAGVLVNDSTVDGFGTLTVDTDVAHGSLALNNNGSFTYIPDANFNGSDEFIYTLCDSGGDCADGTVTLTVSSVNDTPLAAADTYTTTESVSISDDVSGNDTPGDGTNTWSRIANPSGGTLTFNADGTFLYTPNTAFFGSDSFTYRLTDADGETSDATASITVDSTAIIGLSKRVVSMTESTINPGSWDITFEFLVRNYRDFDITNLQVTDDLSAVFSAPATFSVTSLVSDHFTVNPSYNGGSEPSLLSGTDTLDALSTTGGVPEGTITLIINVVPAVTDYKNTATVTGLDPSSESITDISQNGTDPDISADAAHPEYDDDNFPGNNSAATPINFGATIFDPPYGIKTYDASGNPVFQWTMNWINNSNLLAVNASVNDPIPAGSTFISASGLVGLNAPAGGTVNGVECTYNVASTTTTTTACYYELPTTAYPRGRIIWQGTIGPDFGVTDPAAANNMIVIRFNAALDSGITGMENIASIDTDLNGDGDMTDTAPAEQRVSIASATWGTFPSGSGSDDPAATQLIPATGFAPNVVTLLPVQPAAQAYSSSDLVLEIPSLNIRASIVGVPQDTEASTWDVSWLWNEVGWLNGTAYPTWSGNSVLTGHVYLPNGKPGPFVNLKDLHWGDRIIIHSLGQQYTYEVREGKRVLATDQSIFKHKDLPWLNLVTCQGYDEDTHQYQYRTVVRAVLISVSQ